uniref:ATP-dependent DNA helicase n=1 Tax=Trypanosoma vivax (strain Y486) TaxID=1055687 RepID=G0U8Y7_TRYVY|nr:putative DNA repair and recombination helicase protein PIF1, fragment [Trypanosoma vivax Y486]
MFSFTIGVLRRAARWSASPTTRPKAAHRPCNVRSRRTEQKSAVSTNNDIPVLSADTTPRPAGTYTLAEESLPSVRVPTEIPEDVHVSSVVETNATQIAERDTDLAPEKQKVLQLAMDGASLFISGDAGTGKSYLLKCIIEALELNGLRVAVTASTGLAALRIGVNGFGQVCAITMPLTPAYAFTVHKVQGLTFDSPILLDCEKFFPCDHLIYVAASRVRRFSQLRMINISCRMVSVDSNALQFSSAIPVVEDAVQNWVKWKKSKTKIEQRKASPGSSPTPELLTLYRATWRSRSP